MASRKEEERNEKIIRGLMKLPPNRKCINCNSLGPQYVCTNFWTFICITCSGIHREFTHRVKSVSMAKFTSQEVEALQKGGNQRAREIYLKDWDTQRMRLPDSSNVEKIRDFIKSVYVDKKYAGRKSSDKPPRDIQNLKNHEEDHRRASSYHSYSQSPPYEHQYEDRRYGKPVGMLTRKPGSDRGNYVSSLVYSPGRMREQMYEDRFANEGSGPRISDYSASSTVDTSRFDGQSPNFEKDSRYSSPPTYQLRDIIADDVRRQTSNTYSEANVKRDADGVLRSQRTASSGSTGSFDSNSVSLKSVNSGSLIDVLDSENSSVAPISKTSSVSSPTQPSALMHAANQDLFGPPFIQPPATFSTPSSIHLFADIPQPSSTTSSNQKPFSENGGWATFDLPQSSGPTSEIKSAPSSAVPSMNEISTESNNAFAFIDNNSQWMSVQNSSIAHETFLPMSVPWDMASRGLTANIGPTGSKSWNAFDDSTGPFPQTSFGVLPLKNDSQVLKVSEDLGKDGFQNSTIDDKALAHGVPHNGIVTGLLFPPSGGDTHNQKSTNPFDLPFDSDLEPSNAVMDMRSLQAALPSPQFPSSFLGSLPQPWFSQNPVAPYISSVAPGGLPFIQGQPSNSQLPNIPSQGPVAPLGGNPFA